MDHVKILKRAWRILTHYRALWLFGAILALTTFSLGQPSFSNNSSQASSQTTQPQMDLGNGFFAERLAEIQKDFDALNQSVNEFFSSANAQTLITIGIIAACIMLVLIVLSVIAHYVSKMALIKMVDQYENTGEPSGVRQGFRMGWSRTAWQIFLIDLLVIVPAALVVILALILALSPLLLLASGNTAVSIIGAIAAVGLFFLIIFAAIIISEILGLLRLFASRACALGGLGVFDALRRGYSVARQHLKDVGLMWLITLGIRIGWPIALIPITIIMVIISAIVGIIVALLVGLIANLFLKGLTFLLVVVGVGFAIFVLLLATPITFLDGLQQVYLSSTWTLTYRELISLDELAREPSASDVLKPKRFWREW